MQTWITDYNFYQSAKNLDNKRLHAQIYEGIHILSSLLNINDKLVNPKRSVRNYPVAKLWEGHEYNLFQYINNHIVVWICKGFRYYGTVSYENIRILYYFILQYYDKSEYLFWITDELIQIHRSVLIQKKSEHYKKLWPDVPEGLKMRYDFR
jgi:hypothetical protein